MDWLHIILCHPFMRGLGSKFAIADMNLAPALCEDQTKPSPANLFALIIFSVTGFAIFRWASRQSYWRAAGIGVALMVYPYFVDRTWLLYAIGLGLCGLLFVFRD